MGYTPLFDSLTSGTLFGRWPDIGLWPILLSMADWRGHVDHTPEYIAGVTGLGLPDVLACIERFCAPDPRSRSQENSGARLELIDPARNWGWRVVNHAKYREKARELNRTASGEAAEKQRRYRDRQRSTATESETLPDVTRRPGANPDSDSDSDSNTDKKENTSHAARARVPSRHIEGIFRHWQLVHGHEQSRLDDKRRRLIAKALKTYTYEQLRDCISGYKLSPFHQGQNERSTVYDDIALMLRDAKQVDQGLRFLANPPTGPPANGGKPRTRYEQIFGKDDVVIVDG
jgi:hypothetical protein